LFVKPRNALRFITWMPLDCDLVWN